MKGKSLLRVVSRAEQSPVVAIASGKGGVGKTWFSITLAHALALQGERVALLDGDLGCANIDVQLGIQPKLDLAAVISGQASLAESLTPIFGGAGGKGGFDVFAGRSGSGSLADLSANATGELAVAAVSLGLIYDRVIFDLAAGVHANLMRLAAAADRQIVVVNDEPTSLTDAYAFIKVLRQRAPDREPLILVNAAESADESNHTYKALSEACHRFLDFRPQLLGVVPRDPRVRDAIRAQAPLLQRSPQSYAALAMLKVADELRSRMAPSSRPAPARAAR
jgi:flagellar biosynthesis protein FlhG